jgi:hypothetical protein
MCVFFVTTPFYWVLNFIPRDLDLGVKQWQSPLESASYGAFVFHYHIFFSGHIQKTCNSNFK